MYLLSAPLSEGMKIALTAGVTALLGIVTFVASQILQRLFIEPAQEQRRIKGRIAHALTFYRSVCKAPKVDPAKVEAAAAAINGLAADFRATLAVIPLYRACACVRLVLPRDTVKLVSDQLVRWETYMSDKAIEKSVEQIRTILKFDFIADAESELFKALGAPPPKGVETAH